MTMNTSKITARSAGSALIVLVIEDDQGVLEALSNTLTRKLPKAHVYSMLWAHGEPQKYTVPLPYVDLLITDGLRGDAERVVAEAKAYGVPKIIIFTSEPAAFAQDIPGVRVLEKGLSGDFLTVALTLYNKLNQEGE